MKILCRSVMRKIQDMFIATGLPRVFISSAFITDGILDSLVSTYYYGDNNRYVQVHGTNSVNI